MSASAAASDDVIFTVTVKLLNGDLLNIPVNEKDELMIGHIKNIIYDHMDIGNEYPLSLYDMSSSENENELDDNHKIKQDMFLMAIVGKRNPFYLPLDYRKEHTLLKFDDRINPKKLMSDILEYMDDDTYNRYAVQQDGPWKIRITKDNIVGNLRLFRTKDGYLLSFNSPRVILDEMLFWLENGEYENHVLDDYTRLAPPRANLMPRLMGQPAVEYTEELGREDIYEFEKRRSSKSKKRSVKKKSPVKKRSVKKKSPVKKRSAKKKSPIKKRSVKKRSPVKKKRSSRK